MTLTTHHLEFSASVRTPLELDDQAGAAIRGAVVGGLWDRFCANKAVPACAACPLLRVCPVAALIAPMCEDGEPGGEQRPRPYVVRPPLGGARRYAAGESLSFGLGLIGQAAQLFPYIVMAAQDVERSGLGANGGRRGALQLHTIAVLNPLSGARQPLYQRGTPQVQTLASCARSGAPARLLSDSGAWLRRSPRRRSARRICRRQGLSRLGIRRQLTRKTFGRVGALRERWSQTVQL